MSYPQEAQIPIIEAFSDYPDLGIVIAERALTALTDAGWTVVPPKDYPGVCARCRTFIQDGTTHRPFNGNQMFACEITEENFEE